MKQNLSLRRTGAILALVIFLATLMAGPTVSGQVEPSSPAEPAGPTEPVVVRVYFESRDRLDVVTGRLDVWEVHHEAGYAVAYVQPQEYAWLESLGYRVEIDPLKTAGHILAPLDARFYYFDDYYTNPNGRYVVDFLQTTNTSYPNLTELYDIGDAWLAGQSGEHDRDIWVLRITNEDPAYGNIADKPAFYLFATIHAREVAVPELAIRYIKHLLEGWDGEGGYGIDADATWLVNHNVVYVLVMQNPDGHWNNEQNTSNNWRKNMNDNECSWGSFGIDLNRNHSFFWGCCGGSSGDPCYSTYRGPSRGSEPETQAFQAHFGAVMLDHNGPNGNDEIPPAAPDDATGIFITLHSYSDLVLWPWGFTDSQAPNGAQLRTIGRKLATFNNYTPQQANDLYTVDGSTDDWTYGKFGVASFTYEVGSYGGTCGGFFPPYDCIDGYAGRDFWAENGPSFIYAHKIARTPYMTAYGPDAQDLAAVPGAIAPDTPVDLSATITDDRYGSDPLQPVYGAEYFIDAPGDDGTGTAMSPSDGSWGETTEDVEAVVDTSGLGLGQHYILVHGQNDDGDWGPFTAVFVYVIDPATAPVIEGYVRDVDTNVPLSATVTADTFQTGTDPASGYYSMTVVSGTYDMSAIAANYAISTVTGVEAPDSQTVAQNFHLFPICDIFTDDIESGNQGWTNEGNWAITTEASHSPSHSWTDSPGGDYGNYWNYSLISPIFDLSDYENVSLSFWHIYDLEPGWDYGYVEYSTNGGGSWTQAASYDGYDQLTWMQEEILLPALNGQANARLRFRLDSDGWIEADGWHIDDVVLSGSGPGCGGDLFAPTAQFTSNSPVVLGDPMAFSNLSTGTLPIDYLWDFGDGLGTSTESDPSYTYLSTGTFTVTLVATNSLGSDSVSHPVLVEPFQYISLTSITIDGETSGYPGTYTFTTSTQPPDATPPISYTWDDGGTAATSVRDLGVGTHTLTVTATNCLSASVIASHTIEVQPAPVCTDVTGVALSQVTTGTIYVGDEVEFSADIAPDDFTPPYTYTVAYGDGDGGTASGGDDPLALSHSYAATGTYPVQIEVWNCDMAEPVTDSLAVTVQAPLPCVELSGIDIDGETSGYPGTYTFTTSTQPPDATPPISYTWDDGGTAATSVRDLGVGTHTLTVTATNCLSASVIASHTIEVQPAPVCTDVTGVALSQVTTGTIYVGDEVAFSADIAPDDAAKPYTYTVAYGDGDGETASSSDDPLTLSHSYAATGTYFVQIEVWNCDMVEPVTDSLAVTVQAPLPCVELSGIDIDGETSGYPGTYTFTTSTQPPDATPPISYTWDDGGTAATSVRDLGVGTHTLTVTATNCLSASVIASHTIEVQPAPVCTDVTGVALSQVTTGTIYVGDEVAFRADISPDGFTPPYTYTVDYGDGDGGTASGGDDPLALSHSYAATGTYPVQIEVWNCDMAEPVTDSLVLDVLAPDTCLEVEAVALTLATTGTLYLDDPVVFSADLAPDEASKPYTYTVAYGDGTVLLPATSSQDPLVFSYTYGAAGSYTVVFSAWNCAMTTPISSTLDLTVALPGYQVYLPIVLR